LAANYRSGKDAGGRALVTLLTAFAPGALAARRGGFAPPLPAGYPALARRGAAAGK